MERILVEQAMAGATRRANERRVVARLGGRDLYRRSAPNDAGGAARAAASMGLQGGELCGCHVVGCQTCAVNGGCADAGCVRCTGLYRGGAVSSRRELAPGTATEPVVDAHAHHFAVGELTFSEWLIAKPPTNEFSERLARLGSMRAAGVEKSIVMGTMDGDVHHPLKESNLINDQTMSVWQSDRDYFFPVAHILTTQFEDVAQLAYVEANLDAGFKGIGELFVHGHRETYRGLEQGFLDIFDLAAERGVPVSVHWEFGTTDPKQPNTPYSSAHHNWVQLLGLLNRYSHGSYSLAELNATLDEQLGVAGPAELSPGGLFEGRSGLDAAEPLKLVLCHCGVGPGSLSSGTSEFDRYQLRIEFLLRYYPKVYFDLGGMEVRATPPRVGNVFRLLEQPSVSPTLTDLGEFLLDKICDFPTRFVVGTDADNGVDVSTATRTGIASYIESIPFYETFLRHSTALHVRGLSDADRTLVLAGNARALFDV